jgi:hypothetical protein
MIVLEKRPKPRTDGRIELGEEIVEEHDARFSKLLLGVRELGEPQENGDETPLALRSEPAQVAAVEQDPEVVAVRSYERRSPACLLILDAGELGGEELLARDPFGKLPETSDS